MATDDFKGKLSRREFLQQGVYLGAATALLAGCSSIPGATPSTEKKELTVAAQTGGQTALVVAMIREFKVDEKYGLRISDKTMPLANIQPAVISGGVDFGYFNPIPMANLVLEGYDLVGFGAYTFNHSSWVVKKDSPYQSLADLKGKKIGAASKTTSTYTQSQLLAAEMGLNWEKDFQIVVGEPTALAGIMAKGDLQMITTAEPLTSRLIASGEYRQLLSLSNEWEKRRGVRLLNSALGGQRRWVEQNRDLAKRLSSAFVEASAYAAKPENYDKHRKLLGVETDAELELIKKAFPSFMGASWTDEYIKDLNYQLKRAVELGILKQVPEQELFVKL